MKKFSVSEWAPAAIGSFIGNVIVGLIARPGLPRFLICWIESIFVCRFVLWIVDKVKAGD